MKVIEGLERIVELSPYLLIWGTFFVFLSIVPLFFIIGSACEPISNDGCRYWKDCIEQTNGIGSISSPDKQGN